MKTHKSDLMHRVVKSTHGDNGHAGASAESGRLFVKRCGEMFILPEKVRLHAASGGKTVAVLSLLLIALVPLLLAAPASAGSIHPSNDTLEVTYHSYSYHANSREMQNSFSAKVDKNLSAMAQIYRDDRHSWANTIVTLGATSKTSVPGVYVDGSLGLGRDSDHKRSRYYSFTINQETARYLGMLSFRRISNPGYHVTILSPGVKLFLSPVSTFRVNYYRSKDSLGNKNGTTWAETEYRIIPTVWLKAGGTHGGRLNQIDLGSAAVGSFSSWIAGIAWTPPGNISLRYTYEDLRRRNSYTDKQHTIVVEVKFP